jgi:hypothetical protein
VAKSGLIFDMDTLTPGIKSLPDNINTAIKGVMQYHEPQVESYMRNNAPWTDRTSNARNGLSAKAISEGTVHAIVVFHQVPYGPWLELSNNGKYRIIVPTVISQGAEVMRTINGLLSRLKSV